MRQLFLFFYHYRVFLTFLVMEVVAGWMIIQNNQYQGAKFFNSSNSFVAGILQISSNVDDYFSLPEVNDKLASENAQLRDQLQELNQRYQNVRIPELEIDTAISNTFEYIKAEVVNNSTRRFDNYITINVGSNEGVEPGMAAINNRGVVGKVKAVSTNYAVLTSILHSDVLVSSKIKRTGDLCTTKWGGTDPYEAQLHYVPLHIQLKKGDEIVTSGYNAVFPEGVPVGKVSDVTATEDAIFYDVSITLDTDFNELSYLYLVKNTLKQERDSLEQITIGIDE